ncbi:hypothetical protein IG631_24262, partial [Alternaria alternata]
FQSFHPVSHANAPACKMSEKRCHVFSRLSDCPAWPSVNSIDCWPTLTLRDASRRLRCGGCY